MQTDPPTCSLGLFSPSSQQPSLINVSSLPRTVTLSLSPLFFSYQHLNSSFILNIQLLLGPMAPFSHCFLFKKTYILLLCFSSNLEVQPNLGIQSFHWGFNMQALLIKSLAMWLNSISHFPLLLKVGPISWGSKPQYSNHLVGLFIMPSPMLKLSKGSVHQHKFKCGPKS